MNGLELFHFLRPLWLLAVPVVVAVWWLARRRESTQQPTLSLVAPHLRDALTVNRDVRGWLRPVDGVAMKRSDEHR